MTRCINTVAVFGLGKVGELVARLLDRSGFSVIGYDSRVRDLPLDDGSALRTATLDVTDVKQLRAALGDHDALISCLPYDLNIPLAETAADLGVHYFDLTEDVPTTNRVIELSQQGADCVFVPQSGLAPGLIGMIGAHLAGGFDELRSIELKVGALPQNPTGKLGYAFNWSPEGVVNEYLNDCEVVRSGHRQLVPAMTAKERVVIGGRDFEAALTSGGLGTMCETYEGKVQRLDYKTLRYPGHFDEMAFLFDELNLREHRDVAGQLLIDAKPPVNDDVVFVHAAVEGVKADQPYRENYVRAFKPQTIGAQQWRAISWTTSASAVGVIEMVADGVLPNSGFIKQESISLTDLFQTQAGSLFAKAGEIHD